MTGKYKIENIIENMYDGLYFVDKERKIIFWNKAAERLTGFSSEEVVGSSCADNILIHVDSVGNELCKGMCPLAATIQDGRTREAEVFLHHKQGHRVPVSVRVTPLTNDKGEIIGGIELFTDISSRDALKLRIEELKRLALIDTLTDLPNRRHLESELSVKQQGFQDSKLSYGILFLDIDRFKRINDEYGHHAGDEILKVIARTLIETARPFDTIGRWGGEEFVCVFPNVDAERLNNIAERIRMLIQHSRAHVNGHNIAVTVSIGGTLARIDDTPDSIIQRADSAMYFSKKKGRNQATVF